MAIASIGASGGAGGAIGYVLKRDAEKEPTIIGGAFGTKEEIIKQFEAYSKLRPNIKNQVSHLTVSLKEGEHLDEDQKLEFAEKLLEKLKFDKDRVPYLVVEHHDKKYEHLHIVVGRISDDGKVVSDSNLALRAIQATKELEKEFGLEQVEFVRNSDRRIKRGEYKLMERTGELSVIAEAKLVIDEALKEKPQIRKFVESLQHAGFDVRPNIAEKTGKMNGFSFKKDEITFKSSAIAKDYAFQNLQKNGLNYDQARDAAFLIEVKNEFTKKLNNESGRNQAAGRNEPVVSDTAIASERTAPVFRGEPGSIQFGLEQSDRSESITEKRESITERAEPVIETAATEFSGGEEITGAAESSSRSDSSTTVNSTNEFFRGTDRSEPGSVESTYTSFEDAQQTSKDDYLDADRSEYGSEESPVRGFSWRGLRDVSSSSLEFTSDFITQSENNQISILNSQPGVTQNKPDDGTAEATGTSQGNSINQLITDISATIEIKPPLDNFLTNQMTQLMFESEQNQADMKILMSDIEQSKESEKSLDVNIEFRMETPQIEERQPEPEVEEIEEVDDEDIEMDYGLSM